MPTNGFEDVRRLLTADERRLLADEGEELRVISARLLEFYPIPRTDGWRSLHLVARAELAKRNRETRLSAGRA